MKITVKKAIIGAVALAAVGGGAIYAFYPDGVDVERASRQSISAQISALGTVDADEEITVYAPVAGRFNDIPVKVNDSVKAGDILAVYDTALLEDEYKKASLNSDYYEDGYNAAVSENNKNKSKAASASANADNLKGQFIAAEENRDIISINQNSESNYIQGSIQGIEGAIDNMKTDLEVKEAELEAANGVYNDIYAKLAEAETAYKSQENLIKEYQKKIDELEDTDPDHDTKEHELEELIQKASESSAESKALYDELKSKLDSAAGKRNDAASSVNSIKGKIEESRDALASLPVDNMSTEEYARYLELSRQLDVIEKEWSKSLDQKAAAEEKIVSDEQIKQYADSMELAKVDEQKAFNDLNKGRDGVQSAVDGTVIERMVDAGAMVEAGTPLFIIQPDSGYKVAVMVSRYDIGNIEVGQSAEITISGIKYDGSVSMIAPIATNDAAGKPRVRVEIELTDKEFRPTIGLEAEVKIYAGECEDALSVSDKAVYTDDNGSYVYVLDGGILRRRDIETGIKGNGYYQVITGISEGDRVVTSPVTEDDIGTRYVENQ